MKVCDLTQFYSPVSGGVKRYVAEKVQWMREQDRGDEHILIIPGERDACERAPGVRVYTVASPLLAETSRYRLLLRLEAVEAILERERPDVIECGDAYQVAWRAVRCGRELGIPVVGFYHSHFPEAYLSPARRFVGPLVTEALLACSRWYVSALYNRFACTLVPSPALAELLTAWGVERVRPFDLGVNTRCFQAAGLPDENVRRTELGLSPSAPLLLYVGRLAFEKNTETLFAAWRLLAAARADAHLIVIGDGLQRPEVERLKADLPGRVTWIPYCGDPERLARWYRAADVFVHPGVQETFGLVTLEAQACGTPVVGIRGSYMDRIVHSGLEHWAPENSPAALAAAMERSLAHAASVDRTLLARRIAGQYSWGEVFARLFDVYRQAVAEYRSY